VRLHCRPLPPDEDDLAREIQTYALARLPQPEPAFAVAGGLANHHAWSVIETDS
jgi:hypothetical protein